MVEKELGLLISAILTNTVLEGCGPVLDVTKDYPLVVNPDKTVTVNPSDLAKLRNYVTWETFRTFNSAVEQAVMDDKDWQNPLPSGQSSIGTAAGAVAGLAGPLAGLVAGPAGAALTAALPTLINDLVASIKPSTVPSAVPAIPSAAGS